jgi:hemerythrin superfamily protein
LEDTAFSAASTAHRLPGQYMHRGPQQELQRKDASAFRENVRNAPSGSARRKSRPLRDGAPGRRVRPTKFETFVRGAGYRSSFPRLEHNMAKSNMVDAIALLKADHRKVEDLFGKFEKARGAERKKAIAEQICLELSVHTKIEEDIFYPACKGEVDDDLAHEAYVEHDGAKVLIAEIENAGASDEFYEAKVTVLSEMIKHHVKEEEQRGGLFSQARNAGLDLSALGGQLADEKKRLTAEYKSSGLPKLSTPSFHGTQLAR